MCVIALCDKGVRPSVLQVRQMFSANPDGAGLAWSTGKKVQFVKGIMDVEAVLSTLRQVPSSARLVLHFRIATVGGKVPELTHPFIVSEDSDLRLRGKVDAVWFHNGHWGDWEAALLQSTLSTSGGQVPKGALSDSRAMAVIAYRHSERVMALIPRSQRTVWMSADETYHAGLGWSEVDGMIVSNTAWNYKRASSRVWLGSSHYAKQRRGDFDVAPEDDPTFPPSGEASVGLSARGQRALFASEEMQRVQEFLAKNGVSDGEDT